MARTGSMLCYPFSEKRLSKYKLPVFVQPKLDGLRCRVQVTTSGDITLLSSENNEIICMPHINHAMSKFYKKALGDLELPIEFDGELYSHNLSFQEIVSRAKRTKNLHPHHEDIQFHIFDVIVGEVLEMEQKTRIAYLNACFGMYRDDESPYINSHPTYTPIRLVPTYVANNSAQVFSLLQRCLVEGYEGVIVRASDGYYKRSRNTQIMKWKPRKSDSYPIVGYVEEVSIDGDPKDALGALICKCEKSLETFNVGSGSFLTREGRIELWKKRDDLIGKRAVIKYQELTDTKKIPRFPVLINIE